MNDAEKEVCVKCGEISLSPKCGKCTKMQDEIEQYKTQWQNAEDSNIKLSEKILEYRKEIERLKKDHAEMVRRNAVLRQRTDLPVDRIPAIKEYEKEIERLNKKLEQKDSEIFQIKEVLGISQKNLQEMKYYHNNLTARNKALEKENQHLANISLNLNVQIGDFKKSEKAFLETINQQGDEIKELESKIKVARETLKENLQHFKRLGMTINAEHVEKVLAELGEKV